MFKEEAKTGEEAWVQIADWDEAAYIYVQKSWDEDAWDYTTYDEDQEEYDGGQYDLPGIDNAYDAVLEILEGVDESSLTFLDPEDYAEQF